MTRIAIVALLAGSSLLACTTSTSDAGAPDQSAIGTAETKASPPGKTAVEAGKSKPRGKQIPPPEDVASPPADAQKTAAGVFYKVLQPGVGTEHPGPNDSVKVEYTGWTTDGVTFDTSDGRGARSFSLGRVIPGWTDGLQTMVVGEKTRFWIPEELAYAGRKGAPQGMLVFDIELLELTAAPPTPPDVAAAPPDAKTTESGLAYKVLKKGSGGPSPRAWDRVKVHYTGWTTDGKMFDSSVTKGRPTSFSLGQVIPGWTEGLQQMKQGDTYRLWIPEKLAYAGKPGKPQGMLVFDVELLEVEALPEPPPPPQVPEDVAAPPADATKTSSGLAYKVLKKGTGKEHPTAQSKVKVHYSGWTTDGKMFDSSVTKGAPVEFPLTAVIKGWTEGVQLMVIGERTRFWIPTELAYNDRPGKPKGMLVFDIELLEIM